MSVDRTGTLPFRDSACGDPCQTHAYICSHSPISEQQPQQTTLHNPKSACIQSLLLKRNCRMLRTAFGDLHLAVPQALSSVGPG